MKTLLGESLVPVILLLAGLFAGVFLLGGLAETESRASRIVRISSGDLEPSVSEPETKAGQVASAIGGTDEVGELLSDDSDQDSVGTGLLGAAMQMAASDSLPEALAIVEDILASNPRHGSAWFARGSILSRTGEKQKAMTSYEHAIEYTGGRAKAIPLYNLGCLNRDMGNREAAIDLYSEAISRRPDYLLARFNLAVLLSQQPDTREEAYRAYGQLLRLSSEYAEAYFNRGVMWMQDGQIDSATVDFRRTVEADSTFSKAWYNLGRFASEAGHLDQATTLYAMAVQADPENPKARLNLAIVLGKQDRHEEAVEVGTETVQRYPDYASAWYNLAVAYSHLNQEGKARDAYEKVLKLEPLHARAWQNLGVLYAHAEKSEKALACYREALAIDPGSPSARYNLALELRRTKDLPGAAEEVARLLRLNPSNEKARKFLTTTLRRLSQKESNRPLIDQMAAEFKIEVASADN